MDILYAFLGGIGGEVMKVEKELVVNAASGDKEAFEKAVDDFNTRERRFGGNKK